MNISPKVDTAPSQVKASTVKNYDSPVKSHVNHINNNLMAQSSQVETIEHKKEPVRAMEISNNISKTSKTSLSRIPPIIFVIGGPGSNKATLCSKSLGVNPGWGHFRLVGLFTNNDNA